jgi:hypothetical protein
MFSLRKGQKSLEMIIGLVILLVVAGVVISTFLNQFQDNPGSQYEDTLQEEEIKRTCQSKCSTYKTASGIRAQTAAIDYCTSTFNYDADGDGTLSETAGRLYNSYCEDGVKCFNLQTCEVGRNNLDAERCKQIMENYYTSSEVGLNSSQAESRIAEWYTPNGEGDKTIGTCNLGEAEQTTWYSSNFGDLEVISDDTVDDGESTEDDSSDDDSDTTYASTEDEWCETNGHEDALSESRDDVEAGCKPVNDIGYDAPVEGEVYPASQHSGITCEASDDAYICEE